MLHASALILHSSCTHLACICTHLHSSCTHLHSPTLTLHSYCTHLTLRMQIQSSLHASITHQPWSSLILLEEEMFERSSLAGIAGNYQWGLDAGDHQDGWLPYAGTPEHWNHDDRESEDDDEQMLYHHFSYNLPVLTSFSSSLDQISLQFLNLYLKQKHNQKLD